jgi:hypothetical protein
MTPNAKSDCKAGHRSQDSSDPSPRMNRGEHALLGRGHRDQNLAGRSRKTLLPGPTSENPVSNQYTTDPRGVSSTNASLARVPVAHKPREIGQLALDAFGPGFHLNGNVHIGRIVPSAQVFSSR